MTPQLVIFDADDTLWESEVLYDRARQAAGLVAAEAGIDFGTWDQLQRELDLKNVDDMGLSPARFPLSCRQAFEQLTDPSPQPDVADRVQAEAASVFSMEAPLMPDVKSTLERFAGRCPLMLLTKGDPAVQTRRIDQSGLVDLFDYVIIVPRKDASTFHAAALAARVAPQSAWSIGNSLRSDVMPAIEVGMTGIWIDAHVWDHERHAGDTPPGVIALESLPDALELLE